MTISSAGMPTSYGASVLSPDPNVDASSCEEERAVLGDIIKQCDEALTACDVAIKNSTAESEALREALLQSQKRVAEVTTDRDSIFNNKWVWFGIGIVAGGYGMFQIGKAFR